MSSQTYLWNLKEINLLTLFDFNSSTNMKITSKAMVFWFITNQFQLTLIDINLDIKKKEKELVRKISLKSEQG